jgi:hypothetical protein
MTTVLLAEADPRGLKTVALDASAGTVAAFKVLACCAASAYGFRATGPERPASRPALTSFAFRGTGRPAYGLSGAVHARTVALIPS